MSAPYGAREYQYCFSQYKQLVETRRLDLQLARVDLQAGDILEYHLLPLFERLPREFQISSGVSLPAGGENGFLRHRFQVQSGTRRPISLNATYEDGAFYSGTRRQVAGTLSIRPHRGWLISFAADYNQITLAEGRFATRVWQSERRQHTAQPVRRCRQSTPVRYGDAAAWLAVPLPLDHQARQ